MAEVQLKCVQLGREVMPRNKDLRHHRAVITGIKDNCFVVIMKQDRSHEIVRVDDIVLGDKVYDLEELKSDSCEFFQREAQSQQANDFERFVARLREETAREMLKEMSKQ